MTSVCPDNIDVGPVEAPSVFRAVVIVSISRQISSANVFVTGAISSKWMSVNGSRALRIHFPVKHIERHLRFGNAKKNIHAPGVDSFLRIHAIGTHNLCLQTPDGGHKPPKDGFSPPQVKTPYELLQEDPELAKFFKMVAVGVPKSAVGQKMAAEGIAEVSVVGSRVVANA